MFLNLEFCDNEKVKFKGQFTSLLSLTFAIGVDLDRVSQKESTSNAPVYMVGLGNAIV